MAAYNDKIFNVQDRRLKKWSARYEQGVRVGFYRQKYLSAGDDEGASAGGSSSGRSVEVKPYDELDAGGWTPPMDELLDVPEEDQKAADDAMEEHLRNGGSY